MFQHSIAMPIIENNVATKNVVREVFPKLFILYLPHMFKIINQDMGIEHWWSKSYQMHLCS
jgi:hypothetical protein